MAKLTIQRPETKTNRRFFEDLGDGVRLEMVLIPGGTFEMGSPANETDRIAERESPQHTVTVPTFFMGRYPITQAQWRQVVSWDTSTLEISQELKDAPSKFKGDLMPVEQVSWDDATEFCSRLRQRTGRHYRLPSEAEWEYACRAETTTPFHFGETITDQLANYRATSTYGRGPTGEYRQETTPVTQFDAPNAFGLCDMHGNVWEWCQDPWHDNYEGEPPTDGSVWEEGGNDSLRVRRGGSWFNDPRHCRSAYRVNYLRDYRDTDYGFRVVCAVQ
ncbi:MAG: formylglycine-generating enzyme family protein [Cyanobacteria bacterium P01_A01_bin.37]